MITVLIRDPLNESDHLAGSVGKNKIFLCPSLFNDQTFKCRKQMLKSYDALDYWMKAWMADLSAVTLPKDEEDKISGKWYRDHSYFYENYSIMDISGEEAERIVKEDEGGLALSLDACYVQIADEFELFSAIPLWIISYAFILRRTVRPSCFSRETTKITAAAITTFWGRPIP